MISFTDCFNRFQFSSLMKKEVIHTQGLWAWLTRWHLALDRWDDSSLLVTYSQPRGGEHGAVLGHMGDTLQTEWISRNCGRQASYYQEDEEAPGSCERMLLDCLHNSVTCQGTEICYSRISRNCTGHLDKEGSLARDLICGSSVQRGLLVRP